MSKVFQVKPKRIKRVNGTVLTPEMVVTVTTQQHTTTPFYNGAKEVQEAYMRIYAFDYKNEAHSHSYGLIAQNVQQSAEFADMVGQREEDGMYYVNYLDPRLTALLIKSVKQLKAELEELKSRIAQS